MWWDDGEWHHIAVDTAPMSDLHGTHGTSNSNESDNSAGVVVRLWLDGVVIGDSASPGAGRWSQTPTSMPPPSSKARALLGDDPSSDLYPLAGLVRDVDAEIFNATPTGKHRVWPPLPPCFKYSNSDVGDTSIDSFSLKVAGSIESRCSEAAKSSQYWLWRLDGNFNEACGSGSSLTWKSHQSSSTRDGAPQPFVHVKRKPSSQPLQPASPATPVPEARDNAPQSTDKSGVDPSASLASVALSPSEAGIDEVDLRAVTPQTSDASVEELFRSVPTTPAPTASGGEGKDSSNDHRARPLVVLYFSDHSGAWDTYWELYHAWTVTVLLRDVRRKRPVSVLLVRCPPTDCTLPRLAASAATAATNAARALIEDSSDLVGNTFSGTSSKKSASRNDHGGTSGEAITTSFDLLATVNAHGLPRLDLASLAAALRANLPQQQSRLYLFHQNHEKPWKLGRSTSRSSSKRRHQGNFGNSKSLLGPLDPSFDHVYESGDNADRDWRNGYHGGLPALAAAYACWDGVMRQYSAPKLAAAAMQAVLTRQAALQSKDKTASNKPTTIDLNAEDTDSSSLTRAVEEGFVHETASKTSTRSGNKSWRLTYVPLGPAFDSGDEHSSNEGEKTNVLPASQRPTLCFFAGAEAQWGGSPDRANLLAALARAEAEEASKESNSSTSSGRSTRTPLCKLHLGASPRSENEPAGRPMPRPAYLGGLARAVLAPVPQGNNGETFRHYEALDQGALPVAVRPTLVSTAADEDDGRDDFGDEEASNVNVARNAYLDEWCPDYRSLARSTQVRDKAPGIDNEVHTNLKHKLTHDGPLNGIGAPQYSGNKYANFLAALDTHLATSSCPILLLDSWDDLPLLINALRDGNGERNWAKPNLLDIQDNTSNHSGAPKKVMAVDRWQRLLQTRFEKMKNRAAQDASDVLGE